MSSPAESPEAKHLNVRQAAFIGVGAMVGAGIFALLGAAGAVAGAAFKLDAIASIGSAVALLIFTMITAAHLRIRTETGASTPVLVIAVAAAAVVLVTFIFTTLIHEPASIVTLLAILLLGTALDFGWKRARAGRPGPIQVGH